MRLLDIRGGEAEMSHFGLTPAWAFNWATLGVQAIGSALVISNRWTWLGAGALGVFTVLTIPIAHAFWTMSGQSALEAHHVAVEHMGMIGGLILVSILANRSDRLLEG